MEEERQAAAEVPDGLTPQPPTAEAPVARGGLAWLREGVRVLMFRAPRWEGLDARPATLLGLVLAVLATAAIFQRVMAEEAVRFQWAGLVAGWIDIAVTGWLCWVALRSRAAEPRPTPATLLALLWSACLMLNVADGLSGLALRVAFGPASEWRPSALWAAWLLPLLWLALTQIRLLWRVAGSSLARAAVVVVTPALLTITNWLAPAYLWAPEPPVETEPEVRVGLPLTDETMVVQADLLGRALQALRAPGADRVNVYALTYAPYASEDVFMRESAMVARTMRERFGTAGRTVELVANPATTTTLPWATPLNLRKTIQRFAGLMDRDRDVLFLHLTSHGGADGKLAVDTWPLQTEPVTPELLKQWLDEAGVRWRVISVSACYSGSWIAPLAGDGTLVMTAADADHTSYGCGRKSELTFFGRAMYEEALRKTWSFTEAHAHARKVIEVREQEAGKSDGYSNPQISEGAGVRAVLDRLVQERSGR